ncbi:cytochrome d ubiquinol oxidase subunit II [Gleimia sp. 6138-11-ORH1]|uniref:cytochrome d ubiquinol oxidase subunit II n=1 Tax=Gleimia sp. 6138-11-ORH1 TaxID=2973937 RepID=UPI002169B858|nr:cytochrome d ubiquinol oxidase subunit II [Gleimia sp. 6138-11-ORH1]MCS4484504.1 cytochrome d ubiquinol oxidase subunit II [Gleimia sp. 6138-11-ORH1]
MDWLSILWFILIAVLWTGYLILEGFDLGVGALIPFVAKNDEERSQTVKTIGPHWDGNEVWLLTAGGATFAAFPEWYATMFSGMYLALLLVLVLLILRIVAIEWRKMIDTVQWRKISDYIHTAVGLLVPVLLGVAFANLVQGMHIEVVNPLTNEPLTGPVTEAMLATGVHNITGGFFSLLTPFTVLGGLVVLAICLSQGAQFLALKTTGPVYERAEKYSAVFSLAATVLTAVWALWAVLVHAETVWAWLPLTIAALALIASAVLSQPALNNSKLSFVFSSLGIAGAVAFIFTAMAPNVMKSYLDPSYSLTIAQASSSHATLVVMTIVAVLFVPIVLAYTAWSYWVFRARVTLDDIPEGMGLLPKQIREGANFLKG